MRYPLFLSFLLCLAACNSTPDKATENKTDHAHLVDTTKTEETADSTIIPADDELQQYAVDTTGLSPEPGAPVKILIEGRFHKHEVWQGVENKQWMALVMEDSVFRLRPTTIQVQPFFDPVNDKGRQVMSGREVRGTIPNTLLFITGMDRLKEGVVDTVSYPGQVIMPNTAIDLKFKGRTYTLAASGDSIQDESSESYALKNYSWKISGTKGGKKISQELASNENFESAIYVLLWAGDLDRDGIPDLLVDLSNHYNASEVTLFMSSLADKGKLYKKIATFRTEAYPNVPAPDSLQAPTL